MKLLHTVIGTLSSEHAESIEINGLIPRVADAYKDLVPEKIRHLPVVWFSETARSLGEFPVFEVDTKDLDESKLYHTTTENDTTKELKWWVYQGEIPPQVIKLVAVEPLIKDETT